MLKVRGSLLIAATVSLLATLIAPAAFAAPQQNSLSGRAFLQPALNVEKPSPYLTNDFPTLTFKVGERSEALPSWTATLTELASGQAVPLDAGYGWYSSGSDFRGPYKVDTMTQLVVGATYEAKMVQRTASYWHCSIYYSDGCRWLPGGTDTWFWRFTWTGETSDATIYDPPPTPPTAVRQSAVSATSVTVAWTAPTTFPPPTSYEVRVNGGAPVGVGLVTTHAITGLTPSTSYAVDVRSVAGGLPSSWSFPLQVQTAAATKIKVLSQKPYGKTGWTLRWRLTRDGEGYRSPVRVQFRSDSGWVNWKKLRTSRKGIVTWSTSGERRPYHRFRLFFAGNTTTEAAASKTLNLAPR